MIFKAFITIFAIWVAPTNAANTNVNDISGEFEKNILDKRELDLNIESQISNFKNDPVKSSALDILNPQRIKYLENLDPDLIEVDGRRARNSKEMNYFSYLNPDITNSDSKKHLKDISMIVSKTKDKLENLTDFLRKNGIDCSHVAKLHNNDIDKHFYIDSYEVPNKETKYKKEICEKKRGKYNCNSSLKIYCKEKVKKWSDWEDKTIIISGDELIKNSVNTLYAYYVARNIFEFKLFSASSEINKRGGGYNSVPGMKSFLANKFRVDVDNFSDQMTFKWFGGVRKVGRKLYVWNKYHISYKYREGNDICKKWSDENWQESCSLT